MTYPTKDPGGAATTSDVATLHLLEGTLSLGCLVATWALIVALAWPSRLAADAAGTSALAAAAAVVQKSVLDRDEEEEIEGVEEEEDKPLPAEPPGHDDPPDETEEPIERAPRQPDGTQEDLPEGTEEELPEGMEEELPEGTEESLRPGPRAGRVPGSLDMPEEGEPGEEEPREEEQIYDEVHWGRPRPMRIAFCPHYREFELMPDRQFVLRTYSRRSEGTGRFSIKGRQVRRVVYFEQRLGDLAALEVGVASLKELAEVGARLDLSDREEGANRAETLLTKAIDEHDSAAQRGLRQGPKWKQQYREPLLRARFNLRLAQADQLIKQERYQQAEILCDRLSAEVAQSNPQFGSLRRRIEEIFRLRAKPFYDQGDYATVRELLDQLAGRYGGEPGDTGKGVQSALMEIARERKNKAEKLIREAQQLKDPTSKEARQRQQEALDLLKQAAEIWPTLPGLHQLRFRMDKEHPVLHCAYTELPERLSPLEVHMPVQRHAVSLIFEGLVRWVDDRQSGSHHERQLAQGWPIPLERGRAFYLPECVWSDSDQQRYFCRLDDVYGTYRLLKNKDRPGYSPAWSRLVDGVYDFADPGPFVLEIRLHYDHWQPLSLMDAKILPKHCLPKGASPEELRRALERLGKDPVGTGPYRLGDWEVDRLQFVANPHYRHRSELKLPKIKEIVFDRRTAIDAKESILRGETQLVFDVRMQHLVELREGGVKVVPLRTPSVWFLAPNYRKPSLQNSDLRLAIAHAIDRETILNRQFRIGGNRQDHAALTGPYPKDSWAYYDDVEGFAGGKAAAFLEQARKGLKTWPVKLRLAYPQGNPEIENACMQIKSQVEETTRKGITLELQAIPATGFWDKIVNFHDFDLAYWRHDYESPTFWLEPLLDKDPRAQRPGGPNFMGYTPDPYLARLFREINGHKHFPDIQRWTHEIHEHVARHAVVIPLWQLDTYVAVSSRLHLKDSRGRSMTLQRLDLFRNLDLFRDVESWELEAEESQ